MGREGREAEGAATGAGPGVRRLDEGGSGIRVEGGRGGPAEEEEKDPSEAVQRGWEEDGNEAGRSRGASVGEEAVEPGALEGLAPAFRRVRRYWSFSN